MNRNVESHFSIAPQAEIKRSSFDMSHTHKTTFNAGDIIPLDWQEVLPGDTFSVDTSLVTRMTTPIFPVMDNCYLDYYWFFVPNRLLWEHWEQFCGANDDITAWETPIPYEVPQVTAPSGGWTEGTIADYMGIPTKVGNISVSALPFRAYAKIINDWFRDENVTTPCNLPLSDTTQSGSNGTTQVTDVVNGGAPAKASKYHDYFTSALPFVQRGPAVTIPLGDGAPVYTDAVNSSLLGSTTPALKWFNITDNQLNNNDGYIALDSNGATIRATDTVSSSYSPNLIPANLYADLSHATASTINELRQAFQIQRLYEATARSGSRYIEILKGLFGVDSPDARLQRSEYLGGKRIPINIQQVLQTSSTDTTSPQGNTAAYSLTADKASSFTKSFVEHGILLCLGVVRTQHTYQQGLEQKWTRKRRFEFYYPQLAHLGEQPIKNKEIYCQGSTVVDSDGAVIDEQVFGYQEAWATYRYQNNRVSGLFRSNATGTLDAWHYADNYAALPTLTANWISEPKSNIQRTLAVSGEDQFIIDCFFKTKAVRPMPMYSVPGLIDHN